MPHGQQLEIALSSYEHFSVTVASRKPRSPIISCIMNWPAYSPSSSTLVLLFKIGRARLVASSRKAALLTDARLISATEEMNKISDDIREAEDQAARGHAAETQPAWMRWASNAELPIANLTILAKIASWAELRHAVNNGTQPSQPQLRSPANN